MKIAYGTLRTSLVSLRINSITLRINKSPLGHVQCTLRTLDPKGECP